MIGTLLLKVEFLLWEVWGGKWLFSLSPLSSIIMCFKSTKATA